ncbi:MAG: CotH kinase family protein [Deltaproteobacteria bacterium]|nr:CotH kinase family protein [Deltaproteobacteria bacterium]
MISTAGKNGYPSFILLILILISFVYLGACARATEPFDDDDNSSTGTQDWEATWACDTNDGSMPRFMNFSNDGLTVAADGHRLVTGLGNQDNFYKFSLTDNSDIKRIDLVFYQSDWWQQMVDNYATETELGATMSYDDGASIKTLASPVGVRFKGDTSYNMNSTYKKSFNINIDYLDSAQDLNGFNSLNLNCAWGDNSFMREVIYEHINRRYIPALSVNYVDLYINGEYWGVYINSQQINEDFYRQWFTSINGTNWRAKPWAAQDVTGGFGTGTSTLNYLEDSIDDYIPHYTMKRYCVNDPWSYLVDLCYVLETSADLEDEVSQILDLDRTLWFLVMENVFGDTDSYIMKGGMDYYIYWDYTTGLFTPIEYDGNEILSDDFGRGAPPPAGFSAPAGAILPAQPPPGPPIGPGGGSSLSWSPFYNADNPSYPLLHKLLNIPGIRQRYLAHMRTVLEESFNVTDLENPANINSMVDAYAAKIRPYIDADPKTFITDFDAGVGELKKNIQTRYAVLMGGTGGDGVEYPGNSELMAKGLAISDAGWKVGDVLWAVPGSSDKITINATVDNTGTVGGIDSVFAYTGEGPEGNFTKSQMFDDGNHGDGSADDGVFGIVLDELPSGARTRFYIEAVTDDEAGTRTYYPARAGHDVFTFLVDDHPEP